MSRDPEAAVLLSWEGGDIKSQGLFQEVGKMPEEPGKGIQWVDPGPLRALTGLGRPSRD